MSRAFDKIYWHDGNLVDLSFSIDKKGKSSLKMSVHLYNDEKASSRAAFQIKCDDVSQFNSTLDAIELKDNMSAGNISNGYLKDSTLWVYFTDGILEVHAKRFRLEKC